MGLKIEGRIDVPEKKREYSETELKVDFSSAFTVVALIDLPGFLADTTKGQIWIEIMEYLYNETNNAEKEIKAFCEDLKVLGYLNEELSAHFDIDENGVLIYSPYIWHEGKKILAFYGETLKKALQKALNAHRKQDREIDEFSKKNETEILRDAANLSNARAALEAQEQVARKKEWFLSRKTIAILQRNKA